MDIVLVESGLENFSKYEAIIKRQPQKFHISETDMNLDDF